MKTFLRWSPKRQQSLEALCRRLNSFRYAEHQSGVVGGQRTSSNSDKLFGSGPAVLSPFIACRTVPALVLLCKLFVFPYSSICVHLLNCHFYIFLIIPLTTRHRNHSCGTSFRRLKRSMVASSIKHLTSYPARLMTLSWDVSSVHHRNHL